MRIKGAGRWIIAGVLVNLLAFAHCVQGATLSGELKQWHTITLTFDGPATDEAADPNPFTDYRLDVTFTHGQESFIVPGYYAADGNAANTAATAGNKWCVHFSPDQLGDWAWHTSFRKGKDVATADDHQAGDSAAYCDGEQGSFTIAANDKTGKDLRAKGRLQYVGEHYLRFAGNNEWFLKVGPDSPEGFLANPDIDGCTEGVRATFSEHAKDWHTGDPTWADGKGKNVIGAVNYIGQQDMNCFFLITYTGHGNTHSVWPYRSIDDHLRFNCAKLDQWEIIFQQMERQGIFMHVCLSRTENQSYWEARDGGTFAPSRKLYYRELIARFAHHLALEWDLGEENGWTKSKDNKFGVGCTDAQRKQFCDFIRTLDPYKSPIVVHTLPRDWDKVYTPLLGYPSFEGISGQFPIDPNGMQKIHALVIKWRDASEKAGRKWYICADEPGGDDRPWEKDSKGTRADTAGVRPDIVDPTHNYPRRWFLWSTYMAGGAATETYFGWAYAPQGGGDGSVTNYAAWANWWAQCRVAHTFFTQYLPFSKMLPHDELVTDAKGFCFATADEIYAVYLPEGGTATLDLTAAKGPFDMQWYNPRTGGPLQNGSVTHLDGGAKQSLGNPPAEADQDWAILIRKSSASTTAPATRP